MDIYCCLMSHSSMITSEISHTFGRVQLMKSFIVFVISRFLFSSQFVMPFFSLHAQNTRSVFVSFLFSFFFLLVPVLRPSALWLGWGCICSGCSILICIVVSFNCFHNDNRQQDAVKLAAVILISAVSSCSF